MARKAIDKTIEAPAELSPEVADVLTQNQNTVASLQTAHSDERDFVNQLLGQASLADASEQFFRTVRTSKLAYIKEHKLYKAIAGMKNPHGAELLKGTWEEFCGLLKKSVDQIDRDITNLNAFGEEALDSMGRMGIGYREMRQYRRLPDDEKTALLEAAKTGDKDTFLDLAEEIIAKNVKKEEQLTLELDEAKAQLVAKDDVAASNAKRIGELQEKAVLLKKLPADAKAKQLCSEIAAQQTGIDEEIRTNFFNALQALVDHGGDDHQAFINVQIQMLHDAVKLLRDEFSGQGVEWEQEAE
jgi:hypothetical protein